MDAQRDPKRSGEHSTVEHVYALISPMAKCPHPEVTNFARRFPGTPCEFCKAHIDEHGNTMTAAVALQRFPQHTENITGNEARWHPPQPAVVTAGLGSTKAGSATEKTVVYGIAAVATLGYMLIIGFFIAVVVVILLLLL
jgi:hypothetical protein